MLAVLMQAGNNGGAETLLWIIAAILVIAGIVSLIRGAVVAGIVLIIVGRPRRGQHLQLAVLGA
jgi:hypothetical protein